MAGPSALVGDLRGVDLRWQTLAEAWGRYFPGVPAVRRNSHPYPRPLEEDFWAGYAEPLAEFVWAAEALLGPVAELAEGAGEPLRATRRDPLGEVEILASQATLWLRRPTGGTSEVAWTAPSLLCYLAVKALTDQISGGVRVLRCPVDGRIFASPSYQSRYCGERCRATAEKRKQRSRTPRGGEPRPGPA